MNDLWKNNLRDIEPYVPGEQSKEKDIVKLNANENPYPPSPKAVEAIKNFDTDTLRLYPEASSMKLKNAIAKFYNVKAENVFVGNGSDDVLALSFQAFFCAEKHRRGIVPCFHKVLVSARRPSCRGVTSNLQYNQKLNDINLSLPSRSPQVKSLSRNERDLNSHDSCTPSIHCFLRF